jgi:uncharacterized membrane protein
LSSTRKVEPVAALWENEREENAAVRPERWRAGFAAAGTTRRGEEPPSMMRFGLFLAILANSLDLVATALGIHWLGNREGNPLLAGLAHQHWWLFVLVKGVLIPALLLRLYSYRSASPVLAAAGLAVIVTALTLAVGHWLGWMAGVLAISPHGL